MGDEPGGEGDGPSIPLATLEFGRRTVEASSVSVFDPVAFASGSQFSTVAEEFPPFLHLVHVYETPLRLYQDKFSKFGDSYSRFVVRNRIVLAEFRDFNYFLVETVPDSVHDSLIFIHRA